MNPNYYEQNDFFAESTQQPKKRSNFGVIVAIALIFLAVGVLVACLIMPGYQAALLPSEPEQPDSSAMIGPTPAPSVAPTPSPQATPSGQATIAPEATVKPIPTVDLPELSATPLPKFDGINPIIGESANPIPDIVDGCKEGVVGVNSYDNSGFAGQEVMFSSGSGFVISSDGYIITNAHVVDEAAKVRVVFYDGNEFDAHVVGFDKSTDVAVLKVEGSNLTPLKIGSSEGLRVGEFTIAIGDPTGRKLSGTTTFGIISAVNRSVNIDGHTNTFIQTDAAINFGSSGGPLINMKGEVIGITSAKTVIAGMDDFGNSVSAEGLAFAIPINEAIPIINQLIEGGVILRPGMGVSVIQPTAENAEEWGIPENGLIVYSVTRGGSAYKAGLKKYDVIVECDGAPIGGQDEFVNYIKHCNVNDEITIKYWRDGKYYDTVVVLINLNEIGNEIVEDKVIDKYGW